MNSLRPQARDLFLRSIHSRAPECSVIEIVGSRPTFDCSERTMSMDEVQGYLKARADQPTFRLIRFRAVKCSEPVAQEHQQFAWIPDILTGLGIDIYLLGLLARPGADFMALDRALPGRNTCLNLCANLHDLCMIGSYDPDSICSTCLVWTLPTADEDREYEYIAEFMKQNKRLFQSRFFIPLCFLANEMNSALRHAGARNKADCGLLPDEDNADEWERSRAALRLARRRFGSARHMANALRKLFGAYDSQRLSAFSAPWSPPDAVRGTEGARDAFNILEPGIAPASSDVEWALQEIDSFRASWPRKDMHQHATASIEPTGAAVEVAETAEVDTSSTGMITAMAALAMTMVFLLGMLFATSPPNQGSEKGAGENFWVAWMLAVIMLSAVLAAAPWPPAIPQYDQVKSVLETARRQWSERKSLRLRSLASGSEKLEGTCD
ncbi:hypothetical protein AAE478_000428 [Parahypoxylon ruwenzoriense]